MLLDLTGVFAPATTPFDPVTGDLDPVALRRNARTWLQAPLSGLVLFGTTGEGLLLDEEERERALSAVRELDGDRLLLAGTGAESTRAAIRLSRRAAAAGADAVLVHPPAYYRPQLTPEALRDHYLAVAEESPVPVVLYQVPTAYRVVELQAGLVAELARHANIVGIKDSSGDLKMLGALVEACPDDFAILVGSGAILYAGLEVGASGGVLAVADLVPEACCEIAAAKRAGDDATAGRTQEWVAKLHRELVGRLGVPGIKVALDLLGLAGGPPRAPLKPLRERDRVTVRAALEEAGLLDAAPPAT